jgi:hypothetical protein
MSGHIWVPNTCDGTPRFRRFSMPEPVMPVRCCECGEGGWITRDAWDSMREADEAKETK